MKPVKFPYCNQILNGDLPVNKTRGIFLSRWKLSWSERFSAFFYGHIWLVVKAEKHPYIALSGNQDFEMIDTSHEKTDI